MKSIPWIAKFLILSYVVFMAILSFGEDFSSLKLDYLGSFNQIGYDIEASRDGDLYIQTYYDMYRRNNDGVLECLIGSTIRTSALDPVRSVYDFPQFQSYGINIFCPIYDMAAAPDGSVYLAVPSSGFGFVIFQMHPDGRMEPIAGDGTAYQYSEGSATFPSAIPDGTNVRDSSLPYINGMGDAGPRNVQLAVDENRTIFLALGYGLVYRLESDGTIRTIADWRESPPPATYGAGYNRIRDMRLGADGILYVLEGNTIHKIAKNGDELQSCDLLTVVDQPGYFSRLDIPFLAIDVLPNHIAFITNLHQPILYLLNSPMKNPIGIPLLNSIYSRNTSIRTAYDRKNDIFYIALSEGNACDGTTYLWRIKDIEKQTQTSVSQWPLY